ncbi:MBL fold metallo-hydrolase [Actinoplanes sp. L3-i22]|uniref:MBL fold metallo-hydrolase n=1 Tax=Actinoplanes sp. L3-i22 TaxID=2836373 RepID=UPI001C74AD13|nr:MBL fold metallo-hydrolase [Actinoplanes sp. L3-i22]BCY12699.1 putative metallo-hydrolase [Actinoplanes sp. L3-i22]
MRVHHLNCGTMRAPGGDLVCHVLLAESDAGLVLIDTGFGLADIADPRTRLGPPRHLLRPALEREETAVVQVQRLGFKPSDVRHIVVTHFDLDHIGGLADFPQARVHVTAAEADGALRAPTGRERRRFRSVQWSHGPDLVEHGPGGESWRGFAAARELTEIGPGIVLVPLPGHTRGHACVAVDTGSRWLLHCGDAFYHRGTLTGDRVPLGLRLAESGVAYDRALVRANHVRLAALHQRADPDLTLLSAHDPVIFAALSNPG